MLVRINRILCLLFTLFFNNLHFLLAQNLVPNPSFEHLEGSNVRCSWTLSKNEFDNSMYNWVNPTQATTDIHSLFASPNCWTYPNRSTVFTRTIGWQIPRTGKSMVGIVTKVQTTLWKEYVQVRLKSTMVKGQRYRVRYYVSLAESSRLASKNIGAYFSVDTIQGGVSNLPYVPQVESNRVIYDYLNWVKIDTVITAADGWNYITIGNFRRNSIKDSIPIISNYSNGSDRSAYYFLDDVSVLPNCLDVSPDQFICPGASVLLTAAGANFIGWADYNNPGLLLSTSTHFTVSPSISTTYLAYSSCDTNSVLVKMDVLRTFNLGKDTTLCDSNSLILKAYIPVDGTTLKWQDGSIEPIFKVSKSGLYTVSALIGGCYSFKDSIYVSYKDAPKLSLGPDTILCTGQTMIIDASYPSASYIWLNIGSTNSKITVTDSGIYSVVITLPNGCSSIASKEIQYSSTIPLVQLGKDVNLCSDQQIVLNALPLNHKNTLLPIKYRWQDNSVGNNFTVTSSGIYWAKVKMAGCEVIDSIQISYNPDALFELGKDTLLCSGQALLLNASYPGATYNWQDRSTGPTFTVTSLGTYFVKSNYKGCLYLDTIQVNYLDKPNVNISNIKGIENGETLILDASYPNATYVWQDGSTESTFQVNHEGKYWVTASIQNYCYTSDSVYIYDIRFMMPNVFSPNGDDKNDLFVPVEMNGINNASITIFNRWGEPVFETPKFSKQVGWDGKNGNSTVSDGLYFWNVKLKDVNGKEKELKGVVSLLK